MKKRLITMLLMLGMMTVGFMGCQSDKTTDETNENITVVKECSLCEIEKECGVYYVEEQEYIVCDDCYNEFAHGMGLADVQDLPKYRCSGSLPLPPYPAPWQGERWSGHPLYCKGRHCR